MKFSGPLFPVRIMPAEENDIVMLLPFVRQFYQDFDYPFAEAEKCAALARLVHDGSLGRLMLIKDGEKAVGYVLVAFSFSLEFNGAIAFIDELFLEPGARQKGFGSMVLAQVEILCKDLGLKALRLESEAHNQRATALYARLGYHDHKRHLMTKLLGR